MKIIINGVEADAIGPRGKSAYEVAVSEGFVGTDTEWLSSLHGADGNTPYIGENGHWWVGEIDTGVPAILGESNTTDHSLLSNRSAENQHPIAAISGLSEALAKIPSIMTAEELRSILTN